MSATDKAKDKAREFAGKVKDAFKE